MNLQKRFLLLFADYRDALERARHAEDDNLSLRERAEEATRRADGLAQQLVEREREMTDRIMAVHFGQRVLKPHENTLVDKAQNKPVPIENAHQWSTRKWNEFLEGAKKIANG